MRRKRVLHVAAAVAAAVILGPHPAWGQRLGSALRPDTVTVGDVFHAAVVLELPPGWSAAVPDTLPLAGPVENAGGRVVSVDSAAGDLRRLTVRWPLTAWRPGSHPLPAVTLTLVGPEGRPEGARRVELPEIVVESVLPADTAGLEPRPPKDVLGADRSLWTWVLAGLLAVALVALAVWAARRRRRRVPLGPTLPTVSPRERALAELGRIRTLGLLEAGDLKGFYSLLTGAVRTYLDELSPAWGADLTTGELRERLDGELEEERKRDLLAFLGTADRVKFARYESSASEAEGAWERARAWVAELEEPADAAEAEEPADAGGETSSEGRSAEAP